MGVPRAFFFATKLQVTYIYIYIFSWPEGPSRLLHFGAVLCGGSSGFFFAAKLQVTYIYIIMARGALTLAAF